MRRIKLILAYDGTNYHGWQKQKEAVTVQSTLENALEKIFQESIVTVASGRTDAKVHALGQVVSFATTSKIPSARIVPALNSVLPADILILQAQEVDFSFQARYSAKSKIYFYKIKMSSSLDPFWINYAYLIKEKLNLSTMQQASELLEGKHDFSSFQASGSTPTSPVRTIYQADWRIEPDFLLFTIHGNGFLYHMVRNIVGTLLDVGQDKMSVATFKEVFLAKNRNLAGKTAPPQGLYLKEVFY